VGVLAYTAEYIQSLSQTVPTRGATHHTCHSTMQRRCHSLFSLKLAVSGLTGRLACWLSRRGCSCSLLNCGLLNVRLSAHAWWGVLQATETVNTPALFTKMSKRPNSPCACRAHQHKHFHHPAVYQAVQLLAAATTPSWYLLDHLPNLCGLLEVCITVRCLDTMCGLQVVLHLLNGGQITKAMKAHVGTGSGEGPCHCQTNATGRSCYQGSLAGQKRCHLCSRLTDGLC
jgi:hypothetical protein